MTSDIQSGSFHVSYTRTLTDLLGCFSPLFKLSLGVYDWMHIPIRKSLPLTITHYSTIKSHALTRHFTP